MPFARSGRLFAAVACALVAGVAGSAIAAQQPALPSAPQPYQSAPGVAAVPAAPRPTLPQAGSLRADQVAAMLAALNESEAHGFPADAFDQVAIAQALTGARDPARKAEAQARLITATLAYARAVHVGRLPERSFPRDWGLRPPAYDVQAEFARAASQDRVAQWLAELPPSYPGYRTLQQGLTRYRVLAAAGGWPRVTAGPELKLGDQGTRVQELRARLNAEDPDTPAEGDLYDQPLVDAVIRAQKRYGLEPHGRLDRATTSALNVPVERRVEQIEANMERWRWLPARLPENRIQVNIAAAVLTLFENDQPTMSMRAATGRPNDKTPMLSSEIHSIVLNPPWNVPTSIANGELWPKERAEPGHLARNGFRVIPLEGGGSRLQQAPGANNALGRVKFDFENPYSVFLHDTPGRTVFERFGRLVSHGCVRLQRPVPLAKKLLEGDPTWTPEAIDAAIATGRTTRAQLSRPVSVYLLYWTAYVTPDGQVNFRDDPYGWDTELTRRINALGAAPAPAAPPAGTPAP